MAHVLRVTSFIVVVCLLVTPGCFFCVKSEKVGGVPRSIQGGEAVASGLVHPKSLPRAHSSRSGGPEVVASYGKLPLSFEANSGQTDSQVKFLSRGRGYSLFLTGKGAIIELTKNAPSSDIQKGPYVPDSGLVGAKTPRLGVSEVVRMQLVSVNPSVRVVGIDELPGKANYFIGNDPAKWRTNVPTYSKVKYEGVYPGVDLVYYGNQGQLEYDFVVAPGVEASEIGLMFDRAKSLRVDENGELVIGSVDRCVRFEKPVAYQEVAGKRKPVKTSYLLASANQVGFYVGEYDHSQPLVIDPVLSYSTYLGGSDSDYGYGVAVDSGGNAYVTGYTYSTNFPISGAFQPAFGGFADAFVTKFNKTGSTLIYSTYFGGNSFDLGAAIAVDADGNAYVTGYTSSSDFPTANALQTAFGGIQDAFVTKLNATGSTLAYSTYLGGSGQDNGLGIALDESGDAYVTGWTTSANFPTSNAVQPVFGGGGGDAFVTKLNSSGTSMIYSTYLGGADAELSLGIAVDPNRNVYVAGYTYSSDFPTVNALQPKLGGNSDAFVTKLNPTGSSLVYSTYLGGSDFDFAYGVAVDSSGNAYVTGNTKSANFPTANALQSDLAGDQNAFVTKLNPIGSAFVYSTYLGGSSVDLGYSIAVDSSGNAYVTGNTQSTNFPTANALHSNLAGPINAFVTKLNPIGSALAYSTYLGGNNGDFGYGITADSVGNVYVTGYTGSTNFPTSDDAFQKSLDGPEDAFVTKIASDARSTKESVLSQLEGLLPSSDNRDEWRLRAAIKHLSVSLSPAFWRPDGNHLNGSGREVFLQEQAAVRELTSLMHDSRTPIPQLVLQGLIKNLVEADRILASVAISDAAGGNPRHLAHANGQLTEADQDATLGRFAEAIADYKDAWEEVSQSSD